MITADDQKLVSIATKASTKDGSRKGACVKLPWIQFRALETVSTVVIFVRLFDYSIAYCLESSTQHQPLHCQCTFATRSVSRGRFSQRRSAESEHPCMIDIQIFCSMLLSNSADSRQVGLAHAIIANLQQPMQNTQQSGATGVVTLHPRLR